MIAKALRQLSAQRFQKHDDSNTLGSGPINLMEMAPEMTRAARRDAKNGVVSPVKRFDAADRQSFRCPEDVVHPPGYFVEKARK